MKKFLIMTAAVILALTVVACSQPVDTVSEPTAEVLEEATAAPEADEQSTPSDETQTNASSEKILVYLSGPEAMITKLEETFEAEHGDVLDMTIMSCGQLRSKVWTESQAGNIQADVVWGSDPLVYNKLNDAGKLMPLNIKDIDSINSDYVWEGKNYALVNERYVILMYNTNLLTGDAPASYADLANDAYNGLAVMADASQSSTAFAIASALYELEGGSDDYLQALKDNGIMLSKSNGLVPSTIMEGQYTLGIAPHDSFVRLTNKGKKEGYEVPLGVVWPSEGVIALQRPVAIPVSDTRSEAQQKIAEQFVNFLLSKKAQTITNKFGFVSVRNDIENTYLPEGVEVFSVDWESATANEETVKNEYQAIFH